MLHNQYIQIHHKTKPLKGCLESEIRGQQFKHFLNLFSIKHIILRLGFIFNFLVSLFKNNYEPLSHNKLAAKMNGTFLDFTTAKVLKHHIDHHWSTFRVKTQLHIRIINGGRDLHLISQYQNP